LRINKVTLATLALLALAVPARAQLSGAIFTSDANGILVNGNIYDAKASTTPPTTAASTRSG